MNFTTTIPDTPENKKAFEELKKQVFEGEMTLYRVVGEEYIPVATVKRHPDCPVEIYEETMRRITKQS